MDPILMTLIAVILTLIAYSTYQANEANKFWHKQGIPYKKPLLFFGNWSPEQFFLKKSFLDIIFTYLDEFQGEQLIGFYDFTNPRLLIKNIDLLEKVLIKDFINFTDRVLPIDKRNAFDISLFSMTGKEWRALRYKLSPLFTTTKLKSMYEPMAECSQSLTSILDKIDESQDVDMKEYISSFSLDVIGSCAYGIDSKNLSQPDNEFKRMSQKMFKLDHVIVLKCILLNYFPKLAKLMQISINRRDVADYFCKIIRDTIDYRKKNGVVRNDFLQMFMTLKDKGSIELRAKDPDDEYLRLEATPSVDNIEFNDDTMIGNAFAFLNAGVDPLSSCILFTLYELSKNKQIQDKVRNEIEKYVEEAHGNLTYDALKKMTYLEQCVKESLRMYPPSPMIQRICTKNYTTPNGYKIPQGMVLYIPIILIHKDPQIYEEPEKYHPERFDPDNKIPQCAFIPFGNGPRICIAMRFALMQVKHCLAKLLITYEYRLSANTKTLRFDRKSVFLSPEYPILFNIKKIVKTK